jgi:hypothetical protein
VNNHLRAACFLGVSAIAATSTFVACVGDAPTVNVLNEASTQQTDSGISVFGNGPASQGAFCGAGSNPGASNTSHCNLGEHCCVPTGAAHQCAADCTGTGGDFECLSAQDCKGYDGGGGSLVCCTEPGAVLDTTTCSYPIFTTLHHSFCQASCPSGAQQLCETAGECNGLNCAGATTPYTSYGVALCQ